jgi:5-amino-6-(5-phosphoribosylamino)uracil reductase
VRPAAGLFPPIGGYGWVSPARRQAGRLTTERTQVTERPYVLLSCAMSVDGCLDAAGPHRLVLSAGADLDRVDSERASADAVMVGAGTIRRDNPRLLIRSPQRRAARAARGLPEHPARVTITGTGDLDPAAHFFAGPGPERPLVYCPSVSAARTRQRLNAAAGVIDAGQPVRLAAVLADLAGRGVRRLMVEGGASLGSQFLADALVDELQLVVAPFFVGDPAAPRFAGPAHYPHGPQWPMGLAEVRRLDDVVLLRYLLGPQARVTAQTPGGLRPGNPLPAGPAPGEGGDG